MVSPYLPEGVKHHDFSHQNAVLPSSKWEQSSQTYFAAHRVALPRQHPAAAQRAGGAPAAAHESCSVVPWVAMASSRPPLPPLDCVRDGCACASARHVRLVATACQQHAPRCRTPHFPDHALFAVCRRHQPRTLRCTRKTRGDRSPAVCSPSGGAMQGGCAFGKRRCAAEQGCRHRGERRLDPPPAEQAAAAG
jgi:hypothetical protein